SEPPVRVAQRPFLCLLTAQSGEYFFTPASPTHVRELWDFKAGSERSGPFESGEAVAFAFAEGFLPINVLSNPRIPQQQRSEDQMDCVAPPPP
uniref:hypothetical protein n=1 Tax=Paenibacillus polymyxa TaxID=1406 RepID=UPI001E5A8312